MFTEGPYIYVEYKNTIDILGSSDAVVTSLICNSRARTNDQMLEDAIGIVTALNTCYYKSLKKKLSKTQSNALRFAISYNYLVRLTSVDYFRAPEPQEIIPIIKIASNTVRSLIQRGLLKVTEHSSISGEPLSVEPTEIGVNYINEHL